MQQVDFLFGDPLLQKDITIDNKRLEKYAYKLKKESQGRIISNYGGWQSNQLANNDPEMVPLVKGIESMYPMMRKAFGLKDELRFTINATWVNINSKYNFNFQHTHFYPGCLYSGTYYVKTPPDCGNIKFIHPNKLFVLSPKFLKIQDATNTMTGQVPVKAGRIIVFPSWTDHLVLPNESDEDRISIAFNITGALPS